MRPFEIRIPSTQKHENFPEPVAPIGTAKRREQDVRMMKSPQYWPHALLPLKRVDRMHSTISEHGVWDGVTLYKGPTVNVFMLDSIHDASTKRLTITPEEAVEQGWTVD